ncbi:hypothetical protein H0H92_003811 [Tricholoma furcatifolium]|nr:hypothetical protein H0H92_003811 [Tricholoma furcatifolium]
MAPDVKLSWEAWGPSNVCWTPASGFLLSPAATSGQRAALLDFTVDQRTPARLRILDFNQANVRKIAAQQKRDVQHLVGNHPRPSLAYIDTAAGGKTSTAQTNLRYTTIMCSAAGVDQAWAKGDCFMDEERIIWTGKDQKAGRDCIEVLHFATFTTGDVGGDYGLGGALGAQPFNVVLLLWLTDPIKEFAYTADTTPLSKKTITERFYNALCILRNPRFIGLNVQLPHVPAAFQGTRAQFIRSRIFQILQCLLLIDIGQSFMHTHPEFYYQGTAGFPTGFRGQVLHYACQVAWMLCSYATLKLIYTTTALTCVATGLPFLAGSPELWPDLYGSWSDAYTYTYLLGRTAVKSSGLSESSSPLIKFFSRQVKVWIAFFISGLIHCFGDLMVGPQYTGKSVPFFLMNAAAITLEDSIIALAGKMGIGHRTIVTRILGYVWVFMWFSFSLPTMYIWVVKAGLGKDEMLPFSLIRTLFPPLRI